MKYHSVLLSFVLMFHYQLQYYFQIDKKYQFLDDIFLRVLNKHPEKMADIFFNMFKASPKTVIKFLSNKSSFWEDFNVILKMPKFTFIKALFY